MKDLANMDRDDLYDLGVRGYRNAKLILECAGSSNSAVGLKKKDILCQLVRQKSRDYDGQ